MKLSMKDLILIATITVLSFPVLYFTMLFVTGNARIEFTSKSENSNKDQEKLKYLKHTRRRDSLIAAHSEAFVAKEKEKKEIIKERENLMKQQERVTMLTQELERTRMELAAERKKFEEYVAKNDDLENKRIKQLANVYAAMRANEAAQILQTLNNTLIVKIMRAIGDDRQKGKIMAALPKEKAAQISKLMGR